jgi:flagellar biosynthesis protein FlhB
MSDYPPLPVIEHDTTQHGRWLRSHRVRVAIWIAVIEGILVVVHVIPWWAAVIVAALAVLFYFEVGRKSRSDTVAQASWIVAASQALVALVPILVIVVGTLALIAVAILAVLALIALFAERR